MFVLLSEHNNGECLPDTMFGCGDGGCECVSRTEAGAALSIRHVVTQLSHRVNRAHVL